MEDDLHKAKSRMNPKNKAALSHVFNNNPCSISSHLGQVVELRRGTWLRDQLVCYFGTTDSMIPTPSLPPYVVENHTGPWGLQSQGAQGEQGGPTLLTSLKDVGWIFGTLEGEGLKYS